MTGLFASNNIRESAQEQTPGLTPRLETAWAQGFPLTRLSPRPKSLQVSHPTCSAVVDSYGPWGDGPSRGVARMAVGQASIGMARRARRPATRDIRREELGKARGPGRAAAPARVAHP